VRAKKSKQCIHACANTCPCNIKAITMVTTPASAARLMTDCCTAQSSAAEHT